MANFRPRRRRSVLPIPTNRGRLGGLIVMVERGPIDNSHPDGIYVSGNTILPDEIIDAAKTWLKNHEYAELSLGEFLNKMFDAANYGKEAL